MHDGSPCRRGFAPPSLSLSRRSLVASLPYTVCIGRYDGKAPTPYVIRCLGFTTKVTIILGFGFTTTVTKLRGQMLLYRLVSPERLPQTHVLYQHVPVRTANSYSADMPHSFVDHSFAFIILVTWNLEQSGGRAATVAVRHDARQPLH